MRDKRKKCRKEKKKENRVIVKWNVTQYDTYSTYLHFVITVKQGPCRDGSLNLDGRKVCGLPIHQTEGASYWQKMRPNKTFCSSSINNILRFRIKADYSTEN